MADNDNQSRTPRFRMVAKAQVSGWRFMLHRLEHALVRRETDVIDDPQKMQSGALVVGAVVAVLIVAVCGIWGFFAAPGSVGSADIVSDKSTSALYVRIKDVLHPVTNLASARLIVGSPQNPVAVKSSAIEKMARGPLVGIAGAPVQMLPSSDPNSQWTLCDVAATGAAVPLDPTTGLPTTAASAVTTTAIGGPLTKGPATSDTLSGNVARLVTYSGQSWLVYRDPKGVAVRAQIDMSEAAVTTAFGVDGSTAAVPISKGLFDAIPARNALAAPTIPSAGSASTLRKTAVTSDVKVGSVLTTSSVDGEEFYVVLRDGIEQIGRATASLIRNEDSQGTVAPISVTPDAIAQTPRVSSLDVGYYPPAPVRLLSTADMPVTCYTWAKGQSDPTASTSMLTGRALPLTAEQAKSAITLVTGSRSGGSTADRAYMPPTSGRFIRVTGDDPAVVSRESLWWISDTGVRYGIDNSSDVSAANSTVASLGIGDPVPAPWSVVRMFAAGPTLSQADARVTHDGMNVDPQVAPLASSDPAAGEN